MRAEPIVGLARRHLSLGSLARKLWGLVRAILMAGICFIIVYPLLRQVSLSFMGVEDILDLSVHWIPRHYTLRNMQIAIKNLHWATAALNSLLISAAMGLLQVTSCTLIGYGLARFPFRGSNLVFAAVVFTLIVPPSVISVPLFLNFRYFTLFGLLPRPGLNLIGSPWPLVALAMTGTARRNGLFIYMTRQYYRGMTKSLEEAAYVDGAGPVKTFLQFMVPNSIPVIMIVFLFSFVWQWNDLFYSELFLKGLEILSLNLQSLTDKFGYSWASPYIEGSHIRLVSNAATLLYILPVLVLYSLLQRYFIESVERTGIVG